MAIGIVGNYGKKNEGDEAILAGILNGLESAYGVEREEIVVFSHDPEATASTHGVRSEHLFYDKKTLLGKVIATARRNRRAVKKLDCMIIGGGGILMDLYKRSTVMFSLYGWLARRAHVPYAIYGAGAGPIATKWGRRLMKTLNGKADVVAVRDETSKELLQAIGVQKGITVIADPAFQVAIPEKDRTGKKEVQIGVTALPYRDGVYWPGGEPEKYQAYIKGMAMNLNRLLADHPEVKVNLFATKYPYDADVAKEIFKHLEQPERCQVHAAERNVYGVLDLIAGQDLIIGTRLHSLILGVNAKKPVIAVGYHQKVADFMEIIGCQDAMIPVGRLHHETDFFSRLYGQYRSGWSETKARFEGISHAMKTKEPDGMSLLKDFLPSAEHLNRPTLTNYQSRA